ncbi:MAG: phosphopantetheine-binding protein [Acidobacteriota bacterium]
MSDRPPPTAASTLSEEDVRQRVRRAVADALDLELEEVDPCASLVDELGAESLDFLDITFRLEDELAIRMPRLDVLYRLENHFGPGVVLVDRRLTEHGVVILRRAMPEIPAEALRPGLTPLDIAGLVSTETFVRVALQMLTAKAAMPRACPQCAALDLRDAKSTRELVCDACGARVPLPDGDEVLLAALEETFGDELAASAEDTAPAGA